MYIRIGKNGLLIFSLLAFRSLVAQEWVVKNYHAQNGLPTSNVYQCFQDSKGFMWFATEKGLSRFDGSSFANFTMQDGLSDNEVLSLYEDSRGRLWCLTFNGKPCFWYNSRFYNPDNTPFLKKLSYSSYLSSITEDEEHSIWISAQKGEIYKVDTLNQVTSVVIKPFEKGISHFIHTVVCLDGTTYYINGRGIFIEEKINGVDSSKALFHFKSFINVPGLGRERQLKMRRMGLHRVVGVVNNTLFIFDLYTRQVEYRLNVLGLENQDVWNIVVIHSEIWVCTRNGIYFFDYQGNKLVFQKKYLEGYGVTSVAKDTEGNTWFSTFEQGVVWKPRNEISLFMEKHGLISNQIDCIAFNTRNELLIGFPRGGIGILHHGKVHTSQFIAKHLAQTSFYDVLETDKGILVCATGLGTILIEKGKISHIPELSPKSVLIDDKGLIWAGTADGLYSTPISILQEIAIPVRGAVNSLVGRIWVLQKLNTYPIEKGFRVTKLFRTSSGQIYVARNNGIFSVSPQRKLVRTPFTSQINARVTDIVETDDSTLWIATDGDGVFAWKNGKLRHLRMEEGLNNMNCYALAIDAEGLVWVATNRGICSFYPSWPIKIRHTLTQENGLSSDEAKDILIQGDTVWVASQNGLMFFNRKHIYTALQPPPVYVTQFLVFGKLEKKANDPLSYDENNIQIRFVGISYQGSRDIEYRYRLHPSDEWKETRSTTIDLSTLVPDTYQFEVTARTRGSGWNKQAAFITFTIQPPFWQEVWFIVSSICITLAVVAGLISMRYKQVLDRKELENRTKILRIQALVAQMNPHFVFNLLSAIQGLIYRKEPFVAAKHLAKFAKLMRLILYQSRETFISLTEEIETLKNYLELQQVRFKEKFEYSFLVEESIDIDTVAIPPMLTQPFIENAIEHGILHKKDEKGQIIVSFHQSNGTIIVTIIDNGVGFYASRKLNQQDVYKPKGSLGVHITQERMNILFGERGDLKIEEIREGEQVKGTKVTLVFPVLETI